MNLGLFPLLHILVLCISYTLALDAEGWKRQSVYQILTDRFARSDGLTPPCDPTPRLFCGGDWQGIIDQLDYIQGMGFTAIWISPVAENMEPWGYHGYAAVDMRKTNPHFGTPATLKSLSAALHSRSMYLMLDLVLNHIGVPASYTTLPHPITLPPSYGFLSTLPSPLHKFCWPEDYDDPWQCEQCWLAPGEDIALADLDTENEEVRRELYDVARWTVAEFEADGVRVDTVKHIRKDFWPEMEKAAGVFCIGEIFHGNPEFVASYQHTTLTSVLNFATHFALTEAFTDPHAGMWRLSEMVKKVQEVSPDVTVLGTFLDNHDMPRFAHSVSDISLRKNAVLFPFIADGFPITYSGTEQGLTGGKDPDNREALWLYGYDTTNPMYGFVRRANAARALAITSDPSFLISIANSLLTTQNHLVIHRPPLISFLTNLGATSGKELVIVSVPGTKAGDLLIDILGEYEERDNVVVVREDGAVEVSMSMGLPRVFLPVSTLKKSKEGMPASSISAAALSSTASTEPNREAGWDPVMFGLGGVMIGTALLLRNSGSHRSNSGL